MMTMVVDHGPLSCYGNAVKDDLEIVLISEFKAKCLGILRRVHETGRPIVVTRGGERVAEIHPPSPEEPRTAWLGSFAERGHIVGDLVEPIASGDWEALR
ncbi:MAG: type II toxin-antitoxin system Phd/YefM family antitoxin [Myxococcales bacterium]|nr:MAG: type II toxin-antitoxin system Phd/YefM family antitoxin [Myxococcales bacterium]